MRYILLAIFTFFAFQGCSVKEEIKKSSYVHDTQKENQAFKELDQETKK